MESLFGFLSSPCALAGYSGMVGTAGTGGIGLLDGLETWFPERSRCFALASCSLLTAFIIDSCWARNSVVRGLCMANRSTEGEDNDVRPEDYVKTDYNRVPHP